MCAGCHTLAKWLSAVSDNEAFGFSSLLLSNGRSIKLFDIEKDVKKDAVITKMLFIFMTLLCSSGSDSGTPIC